MNIITRLFGVECQKCGKLVSREDALSVSHTGYGGVWWTEWYCKECYSSQVIKDFVGRDIQKAKRTMRDVNNKKAEFISELFDLYDKYDLSISHEDSQGAFIIEENSVYNKEWMTQAI